MEHECEGCGAPVECMGSPCEDLCNVCDAMMEDVFDEDDIWNEEDDD